MKVAIVHNSEEKNRNKSQKQLTTLLEQKSNSNRQSST